MTARELIHKFNDDYGIDKYWPKKYEVDRDTYLNCCIAVFDWYCERYPPVELDYSVIPIAIGPNRGLMFKNVELILRHD